MAATVLSTPRAIEASLFVVRAFVRLREMATTHKEFALRLSQLEHHLQAHDQEIQAIFAAIRQLMSPPEKPRKKIGFEVKEPKARYGRKGGKK